MSQSPKLVVANWKMNGTLIEAHERAAAIAEGAGALAAKLVLCPPFVHLLTTAQAIRDSGVALGAQDCSPEPKGAFTGDISVPMLAELNCSYVIVGHSERRQGKGETDEVVQQKAAAVLAAGLHPIICVGETQLEREDDRAETVVATQLTGSLPPGASSYIVAYEPIWAIGTGKTASLADVQAMHAVIRNEVRRHYHDAKLTILYGGSVKPANAAELLALPDVDGLLVGGASLVAGDFLKIAGG